MDIPLQALPRRATGKGAHAKTRGSIGRYFKATSHRASDVQMSLDGPDRATVKWVVYAMAVW